MTLTILCEGATERNFVVKTLGPHLHSRGIFAKPINLGGTQTMKSLHLQINSALRSRRNHEYVTTMLDLYKLGKLGDNVPLAGEGPRELVQRIEASLFKAFPNPNFIPYVQLHEFEALLLVDIEQIPIAFPDGEANKAIPKLRNSIGDTEPELVNDGPATAPSKRIIAVVPAYATVKPSAGPEIADAIGLPRLREACPHFDAWVTQLENL